MLIDVFILLMNQIKHRRIHTKYRADVSMRTATPPFNVAGIGGWLAQRAACTFFSRPGLSTHPFVWDVFLNSFESSSFDFMKVIHV